jgi:hypothetical protein
MPHGVAFFHGRAQTVGNPLLDMQMTARSTMPSMKQLKSTLLLALAILASHTAQAATQVGVSVNVSQPGFYGRVDIGPQPPQVIYAQPVVIEQARYGYEQRPIYLRVPPSHSGNWKRYCNVYRACGQPVYFVRDEPRRGQQARHDNGRWDRDERGGERDDDRGREHGRGHGRGHGHGHD